MSALHVTHPWILLLLPLALAPLIVPVLAGSFYPSLAAVPSDRLSAVLDAGLRLAGLVAIAGTVLGLAGPFTGGGMVERLGTGANILLLADRSGSMNDTFGGKVPSGGEESKAAAAKRLLGDFIAKREHDLFGLALFATMPIEVMPLTAHRAAILAAVDAIDRPGLGYTNVGRGLALALDMLRSSDRDAARVILLISDGAAVIDPQVQLKLRAAFAERDGPERAAKRRRTESVLRARHDARRGGDAAPELWRPLPESDGAEAQLLDLVDTAAAAGSMPELTRQLRRAWTAPEERARWSAMLWHAAALLVWPEGAAALAADGPWRADRFAAYSEWLTDAAVSVGPPVPDSALSAERRNSGELRWDVEAWECAHHVLLAHGVRLESFAAKGGYGAVVLATDTAPPGAGRPVAVKVIIQQADARRDELDSELRTYMRLAGARGVTPDTARTRAEHERVLRVVDALRVELPWRRLRVGLLVMERAEASLHDHMRHREVARAPLGCEERLGLAADMCLGLAALHRAGLVACDLKPDNVLVLREPGTTATRAVLADMGMNVDVDDGPGACLATVGWGTTRASVPSEYDRPSTFEHDWFVFAKVVLWLFSDGQEAGDVACGASLAPDAWAERLAAELGAGATGSVPLGAYKANTGACWQRTGAGAALVHTDDPRVRRLVTWAATFIRDTNRTAEAALAGRSSKGARRKRFAALRPDERTEPGFVPSGLAEAVTARIQATKLP